MWDSNPSKPPLPRHSKEGTTHSWAFPRRTSVITQPSAFSPKVTTCQHGLIARSAITRLAIEWLVLSRPLKKAAKSLSDNYNGPLYSGQLYSP